MFVEHQQNPHLTSQAQGPEGMSKCPVPGIYELDDIYIMMSVCVFVTKNHQFLLGVSCNHLNPP